MRKIAMTAVLCLMPMCGDGRAQGIPVFDAQGIFQAIQQLQQMQQQFDQLKQTHQAFNKITSMGDIASILNSPAVRKALPADFGAAQSALLGQGADQFKSNDGIFSPANTAYQAEIERSRGQIAGQKSVGQQMYDAASKRIEGLEVLRRQIGQSEDPKTVMDLQARLQTEIAAANTDVLRMQALAMVAEAQHREEDARRAGEFEREISTQLRPRGQ